MAREKIKRLNPDVLTLDVEMPKMDGLTFLHNPHAPAADAGGDGVDDDRARRRDHARRARDGRGGLPRQAAHRRGGEAARVLRRAHRQDQERPRASVRALDARAPKPVRPKNQAVVAAGKTAVARTMRTTDRIIAIGASTGGTEAIKRVLTGLPADTPGVLVTQHIPKAFSTSFARRMDDCCAMTVYEAEDGQPVLAGHVYIAPATGTLYLVRDGARYVCRLDDGEPVSRHKPSVDVLFQLGGEERGENAIGVLPHRNGEGWGPRPEGDAGRGRPHDRAGRSNQRGVGHAGGSRLHRRRGRCGAHRRDGPAHPLPRRRGWTSQNRQSNG